MTPRIAAGLAALLICSSALAEEFLIEHVTVVSPERAQPLEGANVLVREGRIVSVGTTHPTVAAATKRIDGTGKFLTPGLMDSHVHVIEAPGLPFFGPDPSLDSLRS